MKNAERIKQYVKEVFEMYSLDFNEYFGYLTEKGEYVEVPFELDGKINLDIIALSAKVLGMSSDDILARNDEACGRWFKKYSYFFHLTGLNHAYKSTYWGVGADSYNLIEAIFDVDLTREKPKRYDYVNVKRRMLLQLEEVDAQISGIYHKGAHIKKIRIDTENFCHFENIEELVNSYIQMVDRVTELFFKALNAELSEDEIKEYNIIVSAFGIRDKCFPKRRGYLYYDNLRRCADVYKGENFSEIYDYVEFDKKMNLAPWRCAEFVENKELVQRYVNIHPETKQIMRVFAMKACNFKCHYEWSDAKYKQFDDDASIDEMTSFLYEYIGDDRPMKEQHDIYVPKTPEELCGDDVYAKALLALCRPVKLGGVLLPIRKEYTQQDLPARIGLRIGLYRNCNYVDWHKDEYGIELIYEFEEDEEFGGNDDA